MRYFVNPKNMNKYYSSSDSITEIFLRIGYKEITKEEYDKLEEIF